MDCPFFFDSRRHEVIDTVWIWTGKVILESVILTAAVVVSLTAYTFWAAKRGHDFNFLGPFLFGALMVLILFSIIQVYTFSIIPLFSNPLPRCRVEVVKTNET